MYTFTLSDDLATDFQKSDNVPGRIMSLFTFLFIPTMHDQYRHNSTSPSTDEFTCKSVCIYDQNEDKYILNFAFSYNSEIHRNTIERFKDRKFLGFRPYKILSYLFEFDDKSPLLESTTIEDKLNLASLVEIKTTTSNDNKESKSYTINVAKALIEKALNLNNLYHSSMLELIENYSSALLLIAGAATGLYVTSIIASDVFIPMIIVSFAPILIGTIAPLLIQGSFMVNDYLKSSLGFGIKILNGTEPEKELIATSFNKILQEHYLSINKDTHVTCEDNVLKFVKASST